MWTGGQTPDGDALLTYRVDDGEPRYWFADHARRHCVARRRRQARLSHDTKAERRRPRANMRGIADRRRQMSEAYRRALDAVTHEASAIVAKFAVRRNVARVEFDDTDRSFDVSFPWAELRTRIQYKLDAAGIPVTIRGPQATAAPE